MKTNSENIDNLLRNSLENYSSQPASSVRANVSLKVKKFNFFKFNPGSFNVFYLSTLILGFSAVLCFSFGLFENECKNALTGTKHTIEINETSSNIVVEDINNEITENHISENNTSTNVAIETPDNSINTRNYSTQTETNQFESNETTNEIITETIVELENTELINETGIIEAEIVTNSDQKDDAISNESQNSTKTIIYDTVTNINHVSIVDTVKTEVRETIKIKRPRRKNK